MTDEPTLQALDGLNLAVVRLSGSMTQALSAQATLHDETQSAREAANHVSTPPGDVVVHTTAAHKAAEQLVGALDQVGSLARAAAVAAMLANDAARNAAKDRPVTVLPAAISGTGKTRTVDVRFSGVLPYGKGYLAQFHLVNVADRTGKTFKGLDFQIDSAPKTVDGEITTFSRTVDVSALPPGRYQVGVTLFLVAPGSAVPKYPSLPGIQFDPELEAWGERHLVGGFVVEAPPPVVKPPEPPAPSPDAPTFLRPFPNAPHWKLLANRREFGPEDLRTQAIRGQHGGGPWVVNSREWTQGIWVAKASDPRRKVLLTAAGIDWGKNNPRPRDRELPVPADLKPDKGASDAHATVYYPPGVLPDAPLGAWLELWQARPQADGSWRATSGVLIRADGDGLNLSQMNGQREGGDVLMNGGGGAARASGMSSTLGLIREGELTNGIDHALYFGLPGPILSAGRIVWPASKDEHNGTSNKIPLGMGDRLCIPMSVKVDALGLKTIQGRNLFDALQRRGGICGDLSGNRSLNSDRNSAACMREVDLLTGSQDLGRVMAQVVYCEAQA